MTSALTLDPVQSAHTASVVVIVHCGDLSPVRLDRRLREVLSTVPPQTRVIATVVRKPDRLSSVLRRVRVVVIGDGGSALLSRAVAAPGAVIVLPLSAQVSGAWFWQVTGRAATRPGAVGVLPIGHEHVFVYPSQIASLDGPRELWPSVTGITSKRPLRTAAEHRTLGAVLIVKDEEENLASCLASVEAVVDEVVVYDTGSSDATVELAEGLGARVIRGYWDDDFGAARTRALAHSTTDWALTLDADEVLETDPAALRAWLDNAEETAAMLPVISHSWSGASSGAEIRSVRLFVRAAGVYVGALHEQVVAADGHAELRIASETPPAVVLHSGYTRVAHLTKDKAARNVAISRAAWEKLAIDDPRWAEASVDLGRSLALSGDHDGCLSVLAPVLSEESGISPGNFLQGARTAIPILLSRGRLEEGLTWIERASSLGESPGQAVVWRAQVKAQSGQFDTAVADLRRILTRESLGGLDYWGRAFNSDLARTLLAELELAQGSSQAALELAFEVLQRSPDTVPTRLLLMTVSASGLDLRDLAREAPDQYLSRSLRDYLAEDPGLALAWFTAFSDVHPHDVRPIIAASAVAARHSLEAALEWSVRAREAGLDRDVCALRAMAENGALHTKARTLAWAVLVYGMGQQEHTDALAGLREELSPDELQDVLQCLGRVVPEATAL